MTDDAKMASRAAKQALRKDIKRRISALTGEEKLRQSTYVTERLLETKQWQQSKRISVFLSMHDEIRTESILHHIFASNKECFIPRYIGTKMDMLKLHSMEDYDKLPETSWKIKQPTEDDSREDALETGGLDLILMPGMAFTTSGDRLGRGKGYYDSYLAKCGEKTGKIPATVALTFTEAICDVIPTSEHDVPVDMVLYENQ